MVAKMQAVKWVLSNWFDFLHYNRTDYSLVFGVSEATEEDHLCTNVVLRKGRERKLRRTHTRIHKCITTSIHPWCHGYRRRIWTRATRVQILDLTDCISHSPNTLGKGINPIILPAAMGK